MAFREVVGPTPLHLHVISIYMHNINTTKEKKKKGKEKKATHPPNPRIITTTITKIYFVLVGQVFN